jgi:hypothetical protein
MQIGNTLHHNPGSWSIPGRISVLVSNDAWEQLGAGKMTRDEFRRRAAVRISDPATASAPKPSPTNGPQLGTR